jgi:hypothetical protein
VKFGIDNRESMLTRENFKDTWARPKLEDNKRREGEGMDVDVSPVKGSNMKHRENHDAEMGDAQMTDMVEGSVDERTMEVERKEEIRNGNLKSQTSMKMPIFKFQRHGIGAVNSKSSHRKQHPKK